MKILIITGGSNGIGKAIAQKYISEKFTVISISRSKTSAVNYQQIIANLSNPNATHSAIESAFSLLDLHKVTSITLINNAGSLGTINSLGNLDSENIQHVMQLNTIAPLVLANSFIKNTKKLHCKKQIITISSGAAVTPYQGWSVYCTSKAAIEMMTKTIALEQQNLDYGVKCVAIKPGVVDTNMQVEIRNTSTAVFKSVQRFKDLKINNDLYTPEFVANKIYKIDNQDLLQNGEIIDLRKF